MSDAFSFCNFVYWFSIHINIPVYNSVFLTKQMAWAILYLKLEGTFLIGICSVGFASLVFIHWYTLRVRDGAMCSQHYLAVKCINLALGWLKTLTFIYFDLLLIPMLPVQFYKIDDVNVLQLFIMRFHWKSLININSNLKKKNPG